MVTVFLAQGFEEIEALVPVDILRRGGISVTLCSITSDLTVTGAHGISVQCDTTLSSLSGEEKMMVLPGGMPGTLHLKKCTALRMRIGEHVRRGGYVAAICAAPTVLASMGLLKNKKATCFPGMEKELLGAQVTDEDVVVDGKIITGRGAGAAFSFGLQLLSVLKDENTASDLADAMCFKGTKP